MKHPQEDPFLNELFTGPEVAEFREASLREALGVLRRMRQRRKAFQGVVWTALPVLLLSWVIVRHSRSSPAPDIPVAVPPLAASVPEPAEASSVQFISDEELLALFPDQPLALVGPEGQQELVFLNRTVPN